MPIQGNIENKPIVERCLLHLELTTEIPYKLIIVASNVHPEDQDWLSELKLKYANISSIISTQTDVPFAYLCNWGLIGIHTELVGLLLPDGLLSSGCLETIYRFMIRNHKTVGWLTTQDLFELTPVLFGCSLSVFDMDALKKVGYFSTEYVSGGQVVFTDLFLKLFVAGYRPTTCVDVCVIVEEKPMFGATNQDNKNKFIKKWWLDDVTPVSLTVQYKPTDYEVSVALAEIQNMKSLPLAAKFEFAFTWNTGDWINIRPIQYRSEIQRFLEIAKGIDPQYTCEIGSAHCGTTYLLSSITKKHVISIDKEAGPYWRGMLLDNFPCKTEMLIGSSQCDDTVRGLARLIGNNQLDILFIDGDHSYEGVKKDFELYLPFVRENGIIAFHDIQDNVHQANCGVPKFWKEISKGYPSAIEILTHPTQVACGIGVIVNV